MNRQVRLKYLDSWACSPLHAFFWAFFIICILSPYQALAQVPTPEPEAEPSEFDPSAVPLPQQLPNGLRGEAIYIENCAPCHGETGQSDGPVVPNLPEPPPPFALSDTIWQKSPAEYFYITKFGRIEKVMPPWGNRLSDEQIWDVAAYAWGLHLDQEAVTLAQTQLEESSQEAPVLLAELTESAGDLNTLFWTQETFADELASRYPDVVGAWSDEQRLTAIEALRTLTIIPPWGASYRPGDGIINGRIVRVQPDGGSAADADGVANNTANEAEEETDSLANLPVTLTAFSQFEPVATFQTTTDAQGQFRFENLSLNSPIVYLLETTYLDVPYSSDVLGFETNGSPLMTIELPVYTTTEEPDQLQLNRVNWVIDYAPGEIIVGQILSIGNVGLQTVIGRSLDGVNGLVTAGFSLPSRAYGLQFRDGVLGERYQQQGDMIYDSSPIPPGEGTRQLFFSYRLPVAETSLQFEQSFNYPIDTLNLLVAESPNLGAEIAELEFVGTQSLQGIPYRFWQGANFPPRSFVVDLSGLLAVGEVDPRQAAMPEGSFGLGSATEGATASVDSTTRRLPAGTIATSPVMEPVMPIMVGGAILLLLIGITAWPFSRLLQGKSSAQLESKKERLIQEIAYLDDAYERGNLSEEAWQTERIQLKEQLLTVATEAQR